MMFRKRARLKKISLRILALFYLLAGINHFIDPDFYYPLIPPYLPWPVEINTISGVAEILFGLGILIPRQRRTSAYLIVLMLIAFVPSHIYFIQVGGCVEGGLCAPVWVGWLRLILIHPLLILWVWWHRD